MQIRLAELGYLNAEPDGIFGNYTYNAVIALQRDYGLDNPDGMVGRWTIAVLNSID